MTSNVPSIDQPGAAALPTQPSDRASAPESAVPPSVSEPTVRVDTIPASPVPEVLQEMGVAAKAADRLAEQQRQLHFERDPNTGRVIAQMRDLEGNTLTTIPLSAVLDIASGLPWKE